MTLAKVINDLVDNNPGVSEIELNGPGKVFYKEKGERKEVRSPYTDELSYNKAIEELIESAGLKVRDYLVEGRYILRDGRSARLHITMPPASVYPMLTLAIKTQDLKSLAAIQSMGTFDTQIALFLKAAVGAKLTTVFSGGTGAGKTTMLEAVTSEFDQSERIGVCEDSPELHLKNENTAYLSSTVWVPGLDMNDVAPLSWCVKQINRMRVDRVIVGETRGEEFFDFVTAANSGAEGSLTTIHANDPRAALKKMTTFVYMAVDLNARVINEMIAQSIDIVVQLGRNQDGGHRILEIAEVTEIISSGESPTVVLNPLFTYNEASDSWTRNFPSDQLKKRLQEFGYDPISYKPIKTEEDEVEGLPGLPSYFKRGGE